MTNKSHRIRVRALDGKPRDQKALNQLKSNQLKMPHLDIIPTNVMAEFIIAAAVDKHIEQVRGKLSDVGLEEIPGGDTTIPTNQGQASARNISQKHQGAQRHGQQRQQGQNAPGAANTPSLSEKPYAFVSLPAQFTTDTPIWHDGASSAGKCSGEIRFELETLTPLLVGWERQVINETEEAWIAPCSRVDHTKSEDFVQAAARSVYPDATDEDPEKRRKNQRKVEKNRRQYIERIRDRIVHIEGAGFSIDTKSVLCPLRAPRGKRPVIIPGDSLKGLLRHELGALLGAPMERVAERSYSYRVAERSYSYRPNALSPNKPNPFLVPRLARVPADGVELRELDGQHQVRVPVQLELLPANLKYDKNGNLTTNFYRFVSSGGQPYKGGLGAGHQLNSKRRLHKQIRVHPNEVQQTVPVPQLAQDSYLATLRHLTDLDHGHFSERHPDVPNVVTGDTARNRILEAAANKVFQPGDLIWVEWDTQKQCIVSFGWHYYYRWAYVDTVRKDADAPNGERKGLFPLPCERQKDNDGAPIGLSAIRRLFGYTGDNEGSAGIGRDDYEQLMGRISINAALEVVGDAETDEQRFLPPTFLKELGMPRPSAVEFYLKQPYYPDARPSDQAKLVTYGDAAGYDAPGELAGRKFYLDRPDAYTGEPWKDDSEANRANERSTLALEASKPGRKFRFTLRFRDLDPHELAAILAALCPHQFREVLGGDHREGYCSKLGYARPLGWGSVRIEAKALLFLGLVEGKPELKAEQNIPGWVQQHYQPTGMQAEWLAVHRHKHPDASDYPRAKDKHGNENIYTYHTNLRAEHSQLRRYRH